jgi:hypothetical protein
VIHQCCGILGLLCSGIILCSCVTDEYKSSAPPLSDQSLKRLQEIAENEMQRGNTLSLRFHATLNVIGQLPYDKSTLPVVSPTGEFIATSVGIAPEKSTLLAEPGSPSPLATGVEIWKLNKSKGTFESVFNLDPPLLLGRSADAEGFLIESPSPEGARRIGKVAWETGELTWLVADGRVNAFATIGPDGQLAWSSREVNQSGFTLVVRNNQGRELEIGPNGGNWFFPTWSTRNNRLYAFWLSPNMDMKVVSMLTISSKAMSDSMTKLHIGENGSPEILHRTVATQYVIQDLPAPPREELLFWHPNEKYLVGWDPEESSPYILLSDAMAATHDVSGRYVISTSKDLRYVDPSRMHQAIRLHNEVAIPFRTSDDSGLFLVLTPGSDRVAVRTLIPITMAPTATSTMPSS